MQRYPCHTHTLSYPLYIPCPTPCLRPPLYSVALRVTPLHLLDADPPDEGEGSRRGVNVDSSGSRLGQVELMGCDKLFAMVIKILEKTAQLREGRRGGERMGERTLHAEVSITKATQI